VIEKFFEIGGWRPRICKNFEITRRIYSNSEWSDQFLVTECFFNLFLEVGTWKKILRFRNMQEKLENYFAYLDKTPWFQNSSSGQFLNSMYLWRHKLTQFWGTIIAEKWQLFFLSGTLSLHYIHCVTVDQISKAYIYAFSNTYVRVCQIDDTWGEKKFKTKNSFKGTFMMEKILNGIVR
jgi:hypothetical protein